MTDASADAIGGLLAESTTSHVIFALDADGMISTWPGPAAALYGHDANAVLGRQVDVLFADECDETTDDFLSDAAKGTAERERRHRRANGTEFWGTLTLSPLAGGVDGYAAVSQDTTERKALERENDRLKEFTDILAHDLRNPLSVIDGYLTLYGETGDPEHIETVRETTARMTRLVEDLLRIARQGAAVTDPEPTDVGAVVDTAWLVVATSSSATLRYDDVPAVRADPDRLRELFENLFRNAVEHSSTGSRKPAASSDAVQHDSDVSVRVGPLSDGFYVEDDGPGIPADRRAVVFDHGFTTTADGNGYGLSIVRTIVNAHGWDIAVTAADSGGARFEITGVDVLE